MNTITFFDVETNGKAIDFYAPYTDTNNWPRIVQMAWAVYTPKEECLQASSFLIKPDGWIIPDEVVKVHGITTEMCEKDGIPIAICFDTFDKDCETATKFVAHNLDFDKNVIACEYHRRSTWDNLSAPPWALHAGVHKELYCTMKASTNYCRLSGGPKRGQFKWPKLIELHEKLFGVGFVGAHSALTDVQAMAKCYFELQRRLSSEPSTTTFLDADAYTPDLEPYHDSLQSKYILLGDYKVKVVSQKGTKSGALLCVNTLINKEGWVPKSQLRCDEEGQLYVLLWFVDKLPR